MMLHNAIRDAQSGQHIEVIATDPSTEKDISNFCEFLGHTLVEFRKEANLFIFVVQKKKKEK